MSNKVTAESVKSLETIFAENKPKGQKGTTENIYKISLGKTKDEQKKNRQKIRSYRDRFISNCINEPTKENWNAWIKFASEVYKDINKYYSSNASETSKDLFNEFEIATKEFRK